MYHVSKNRYVLWGTSFAVLDQITKLIFWSRDFFIGPVHVHSMKNYALAFSLDFGLVPNMLVIIGALAYFVYLYFANRSSLSNGAKLFFALIFAGAISNLADRIYLGYVRDLFDVGLAFTFNLADLSLAAGLIGLVGINQKISKKPAEW